MPYLASSDRIAGINQNKVESMLELYYFPTATCGYKARLTLAEKAVDFTHHVLDRDAGDLVTPAYLKLNPNAVVPTMVHNGDVLIESSIIMVYTDTAFEGPALQPRSALGRARVAAWLKRADDHYLPALGAVTYGLFRRKDILRKTPEELETYYREIPDPERRAQRREVVEKGIRAAKVRDGFLTLDQMLAAMDVALSLPEDTKMFCGHEYTMANLKFCQTAEGKTNKAIEEFAQFYKQKLDDGIYTVPSLLSDEKHYNVFMRCRNPEL